MLPVRVFVYFIHDLGGDSSVGYYGCAGRQNKENKGGLSAQLAKLLLLGPLQSLNPHMDR